MADYRGGLGGRGRDVERGGPQRRAERGGQGPIVLPEHLRAEGVHGRESHARGGIGPREQVPPAVLQELANLRRRSGADQKDADHVINKRFQAVNLGALARGGYQYWYGTGRMAAASPPLSTDLIAKK